MEVLLFITTLAIAVMGLLSWQSKLPSWERPWIAMSFLAHVVSSVVLILMTKYFFGGGDLLAYHYRGLQSVALLQSDLVTYTKPFLLYLVGKESGINLDFEGTSTGSMIALSTWLNLPLPGYLYVQSLIIALVGFFCKYLIYCSFSLFFNPKLHRYVLWATMLLPSAVFWTSGMLKEPMAMIGMGPLVYGSICLVLRRGYLKGIALVLLGGGIVSIFKAYILFPWLLAMLIGFFWQSQISSPSKKKSIYQPVYLLLIVAMALGGIVLLGELFPRYSFSSISKEIGNLQVIGQRTSGGSNYMVSSAPARDSSTQLLMLPLGLFFSLFRPFIFEARNAALLLNALETTFFLFLWGRLLFVQGIRRTVRLILGTPGIMGGLLFVVLFGAVVGIATTNIGTLSRYRIPMMPFYVSILLLLSYAPKMSSSSPNAR